jgi:hypothetical protein
MAAPLGGAAVSLDNLLKFQQESRFWFWQAAIERGSLPCVVD